MQRARTSTSWTSPQTTSISANNIHLPPRSYIPAAILQHLYEATAASQSLQLWFGPWIAACSNRLAALSKQVGHLIRLCGKSALITPTTGQLIARDGSTAARKQQQGVGERLGRSPGVEARPLDRQPPRWERSWFARLIPGTHSRIESFQLFEREPHPDQGWALYLWAGVPPTPHPSAERPVGIPCPPASR